MCPIAIFFFNLMMISNSKTWNELLEKYVYSQKQFRLLSFERTTNNWPLTGQFVTQHCRVLKQNWKFFWFLSVLKCSTSEGTAIESEIGFGARSVWLASRCLTTLRHSGSTHSRCCFFFLVFLLFALVRHIEIGAWWASPFGCNVCARYGWPAAKKTKAGAARRKSIYCIIDILCVHAVWFISCRRMCDAVRVEPWCT